MADWTILADDLTGACDTGVAFAKRGLPTRVAFSAEADFTGARVRVVTTESRGLPEEEAARVVEQVTHVLGLSAADRIYKKIDSTLRGWPSAELAAVMRSAGVRRAVVTPAFPGQRRVVRDGRVYVHGVPLEQTSPGREAAEPDLRRLFGRWGAAKVIRLEEIHQGAAKVSERMAQFPEGVIVADAETDADLQILVEACRGAGIRLLGGSAGLARALVEKLDVDRVDGCESAAEDGLDSFTAKAGPVLGVSGSYNPVSRRQVEAARESGVRVIPLGIDRLRIATKKETESNFASELEQANILDNMVAEILAGFRRGENIVLCAESHEKQPGKEKDICASLAATAASALSAAAGSGSPAGGLVLTGGETAAQVCRALGCAALDLGGEVRPGIAWGWLASGRFTGMRVVTKAGGFGDENTLVEVIRFLRGGSL